MLRRQLSWPGFCWASGRVQKVRRFSRFILFPTSAHLPADVRFLHVPFFSAKRAANSREAPVFRFAARRRILKRGKAQKTTHRRWKTHSNYQRRPCDNTASALQTDSFVNGRLMCVVSRTGSCAEALHAFFLLGECNRGHVCSRLCFRIKGFFRELAKTALILY